MKWIEFKSFDQYFGWFKNLAEKEPFTFKVGVFSPTEDTTFNGSGLFFKYFFPDKPKSKILEDCPVGKINDRRILLDSSLIYSGTDKNIRQFDMFKHDDDFPALVVPPDFWFVFSHSCTLPKTSFANVLPGYLSQQFKTHLMTLDAARSWKSPSADQEKNVFRNIEDNMSPRFIALPPNDLWNKERGSSETLADYLIIDLDQPASMLQRNLISKKPILSFTFEGLCYMQARFALRFGRDLKMTELKEWDDNRRLGHQSEQDG